MLCAHGSEITMLYAFKCVNKLLVILKWLPVTVELCKQITGHTEMASCYSGTLY